MANKEIIVRIRTLFNTDLQELLDNYVKVSDGGMMLKNIVPFYLKITIEIGRNSHSANIMTVLPSFLIVNSIVGVALKCSTLKIHGHNGICNYDGRWKPESYSLRLGFAEAVVDLVA